MSYEKHKDDEEYEKQKGHKYNQHNNDQFSSAFPCREKSGKRKIQRVHSPGLEVTKRFNSSPQSLQMVEYKKKLKVRQMHNSNIDSSKSSYSKKKVIEWLKSVECPNYQIEHPSPASANKSDAISISSDSSEDQQRHTEHCIKYETRSDDAKPRAKGYKTECINQLDIKDNSRNINIIKEGEHTDKNDIGKNIHNATFQLQEASNNQWKREENYRIKKAKKLPKLTRLKGIQLKSIPNNDYSGMKQKSNFSNSTFENIEPKPIQFGGSVLPNSSSNKRKIDLRNNDEIVISDEDIDFNDKQNENSNLYTKKSNNKSSPEYNYSDKDIINVEENNMNKTQVIRNSKNDCATIITDGESEDTHNLEDNESEDTKDFNDKETRVTHNFEDQGDYLHNYEDNESEDTKDFNENEDSQNIEGLKGETNHSYEDEESDVTKDFNENESEDTHDFEDLKEKNANVFSNNVRTSIFTGKKSEDLYAFNDNKLRNSEIIDKRNFIFVDSDSDTTHNSGDKKSKDTLNFTENETKFTQNCENDKQNKDNYIFNNSEIEAPHIFKEKASSDISPKNIYWEDDDTRSFNGSNLYIKESLPKNSSKQFREKLKNSDKAGPACEATLVLKEIENRNMRDIDTQNVFGTESDFSHLHGNNEVSFDHKDICVSSDDDSEVACILYDKNRTLYKSIQNENKTINVQNLCDNEENLVGGSVGENIQKFKEIKKDLNHVIFNNYTENENITNVGNNTINKNEVIINSKNDYAHILTDSESDDMHSFEDNRSKDTHNFEDNEYEDTHNFKDKSEGMHNFEDDKSDNTHHFKDDKSEDIHSFEDNKSEETHNFEDNKSDDTHNFEDNKSDDMHNFEVNKSEDTNNFEDNKSEDTNNFEDNKSDDPHNFEDNKSEDPQDLDNNRNEETHNFEDNKSVDTHNFENNKSDDMHNFEDNKSEDTNNFDDNKSDDPHNFEDNKSEDTQDLNDNRSEVTHNFEDQGANLHNSEDSDSEDTKDFNDNESEDTHNFKDLKDGYLHSYDDNVSDITKNFNDNESEDSRHFEDCVSNDSSDIEIL